MFQVGENVFYGVHGVCEITAIEKQKVSMQIAEYYVLKPLNASDTRFYVPVKNELAVKKMHPLIHKDELSSLLKASYKDVWIKDENQRKQRYKELIVSSDRYAIYNMVCTIDRKKKLPAEVGKKIHQCDENFLKDAMKLLVSEVCIVMDLSPEDAEKLILNSLK